jgi:hypothetical protein
MASHDEPQDEPFAPTPSPSCCRVYLEPALCEVGKVTAVRVGLMSGFDAPVPDGSAMPKIQLVQWQLQLPSTGEWRSLPPYAKPFPWDPHTIVPNVDMAGWVVRAAAVLVHSETDEPVSHVDADGRRRAVRFATSPLRISVPRDLEAAAEKAATMDKFGFHCSKACRADVRLAGLLSRRDEKTLLLEAVRIPDSDSEAMKTVWSATVDLTAPDAVMFELCRLSIDDQVTATLRGERTGAEDKPPALDVCFRTARDRDMVAHCLRAVLAAWTSRAQPA